MLIGTVDGTRGLQVLAQSHSAMADPKPVGIRAFAA